MSLSSTDYAEYLKKPLIEREDVTIFDPLYCAALHNAIVQHIIALDPEYPEGDWNHLRNIIQLYPSAVCELSYMGIVFDTSTGTGMYMDPENMSEHYADQDHWVPLDFILRAWLRMFERGRFYFDGEMKDRFYVMADLEEDVQAWEEYLDVLEPKVREVLDVSTDLGQAGIAAEESLALVHPTLVRLYGIRHIGPGLACYDNDLFSKVFEAPAVALEQGSGRTISISSNQLSPFVDWDWDSKTCLTLLFPAVGPNSDSVTLRYGDPSTGVRRPGMYLSEDSVEPPNVEIVDHQANTEIFRRRSHPVPWGDIYGNNPLSYMLKAFKTMLLKGHWTVNGGGIAGDFTWFAENKDIKWSDDIVLVYTSDADGYDLDITNEWINDLLPTSDGEPVEEATID
ncbi:hypothetical protein DV735_g3418, partial [Chaetothyriales sp. CBS 134920]